MCSRLAHRTDSLEWSAWHVFAACKAGLSPLANEAAAALDSESMPIQGCAHLHRLPRAKRDIGNDLCGSGRDQEDGSLILSSCFGPCHVGIQPANAEGVLMCRL